MKLWPAIVCSKAGCRHVSKKGIFVISKMEASGKCYYYTVLYTYVSAHYKPCVDISSDFLMMIVLFNVSTLYS